MSELGGLQKHENFQHAPILGYEARHCCCWPAEGSPNFPLGKGTEYNRKKKRSIVIIMMMMMIIIIIIIVVVVIGSTSKKKNKQHM